jgi:anti-sigma factor RsiW
MRAQISNRDYEQISAYLDGQLSSNEQRKLEERLKARPDLQTVLDDLQRTKNLLRMAPHKRAPRNFMLTPAMVGQQKTKNTQSSFLNFFPALSFASGLAVFALVLSMVFQLIPGNQGSPAMVADNPQAKQVAMAPTNAQTSVTGEGERMQSQPRQETPAAPEAAMMESQNPGTETPEVATNAQENGTAPEGTPPVIVWNGISGQGGGGGPDVNSAPAPAAKDAFGIGGGAPGDSQVLPSDGIVIPLEGVNSLEPTQTGTQTTPDVVSQDAYAQPGGGPILGIPPADQTGVITSSSALEGAREASQANPLGAEVVSQNAGSLRLIQVLLAVFAIITGAAAFLMRKRNAR